MRVIQKTSYTREDGELERGSSQREPGIEKPSGATRIGHLSDFHLGRPVTEDEWSGEEIVDRWYEIMSRCEADVVVISGDLVERPGDRTWLAAIKEKIQSKSIPSLVVPGNHDILSPGEASPFEEHFGVYPRENEYGDVKFILFDSMKGIPASERTDLEREEAAKNHGAFSRGEVGDQQRVLGRGLATGGGFQAKVLVLHHHLRRPPVGDMEYPEDRDPDEPHGLMAPLDDSAEVLDWARDRDIDLIFHGHKHRFWPPYIERTEILVVNSGSCVHGKPNRRARLVDIRPKGQFDVYDLGFL